MRMGAAMMRFGSNLHPTAALSGLTPRFLGHVPNVGPAEKGDDRVIAVSEHRKARTNT